MFEICVPSRMGTDHCARASRSIRRRRGRRVHRAWPGFRTGMSSGAYA